MAPRTTKKNEDWTEEAYFGSRTSASGKNGPGLRCVATYLQWSREISTFLLTSECCGPLMLSLFKVPTFLLCNVGSTRRHTTFVCSAGSRASRCHPWCRIQTPGMEPDPIIGWHFSSPQERNTHISV